MVRRTYEERVVRKIERDGLGKVVTAKEFEQAYQDGKVQNPVEFCPEVFGTSE